MSLVRINHRPPLKQLIVFAICWLAFIGGWAAYLGWRNGYATPLPMALAALSLLGPILALISREGLRLLYVGACYAAFPIGWVISHILLAFVYYGVMTPIGLMMRVVGYDPMTRKIDPSASTYWEEREQVEDRKRYFRQF